MSASYPGAVKAFTNRSAGQQIASAHVNDLQDEVNAIEAGLLNGTAPLNSSNSTVVSLSVTGALKLRGNVYTTPSSGATANDVLTCISTSGSTSVLEWRPTNSVGVTRTQLKQTATQQIANTVWTALNWDQEDINVGPMHSTSVNSSRITFATSTGEFLFTASLGWANFGGNYMGIRLTKNSTTFISPVIWNMTITGSTAQSRPSVSVLHRITSTADFVCVEALFSGSTASTPVSTNNWDHNSFTAIQISA